MDMQVLFARLGGIKPVSGDRLVGMPEGQITAIEKQLRARLPQSYRKFLATYGASAFSGASPDNPFIVVRSIEALPQHVSRNGKVLFNAFYGSGKDEHDAYGLSVRIRFYSGRMPDSMIPVADSWGNQICLGISGPEKGKVYYWDQENEALDEETYLEEYGEPRPPKTIFQNLHEIATSFEDFLQRLELKAD